MKEIFTSLIILCLCLTGNAQGTREPKNTVDKNHKFIGNSLVDIRYTTPKKLAQLAKKERLESIKKDRFLFSLGTTIYNSHESMAVRFEQNTGSSVYEGTSVNWANLHIIPVIIDGTASVDFANVIISPENAGNYRYRVIQNYERELVGWSTPTKFVKTKDGKAVYATLGKFNYQPNQVLLIEIYNTKDFKDKDAIIIDWRCTPSGRLSVGLDYTKKSMQGGPFSISLDSLSSAALQRNHNFIETTDFKDVKFRLGDSLVRMSIRLDKANLIKYDLQLKKTIDGKTEILNLGDYANWRYLYKEFWNKPGSYELIFTPKLPSWGGSPYKYIKSKAIRFKFTILPAIHQSIDISYKTIGIGVFGILALSGLIIWYFVFRNRMKLLAEKQKKDLAVMQLGSVRAQLNPHFMYNALAGIQNLINKEEIDTANRYLGKFARLTRNVLDDKNNDLTSIANEKALLDDYLQMEQLRFGFTYAISIGSDVDTNTEIPAMLLQPFVENSIKHGIAALTSKGEIEIDFSKTQNNLLVTVKDNGKGFDSNVNYPGLGIRLLKNRISLLNTIYKNTPVELQIISTENGTTTTLILKDWL